MDGESKRNELAGELSQAELESVAGGSSLPSFVATLTPTITAQSITTQTSSNQDKDDWLTNSYRGSKGGRRVRAWQT